MDDRQSLSNEFNKFSIGDDDDDNRNKKQLFLPIDDDIEHSDKDEAVSIFHSFWFTNLLFGQLAELFVTESFGDNCDYQHQNAIASTKNNNTYSQVIEFNLFNNDPSNRLRHGANVILSSTLATSIHSFREKVMNIAHWLFIIIAIEFLASSSEYFIWTITIK
ncbi:unnamed protein product [Rotaria sordida]|uniref:Uncharacterized protein n=1 Tax=Rotaria sordida TaxID=392033 RepID=A0A814ZCL7_9BILA|nr:unnamed protein product [Rotaria sordida]